MRGCYSPELNSMNRDSSSFRNSGTYTSPGTPDYADNNGRGFQKGWCSERVRLSNNGKIRRTSVNVLMPFNNGRTLPSKWDDAERWITSPVSGTGVSNKNLGVPPQRRPKSKSGPLGPTPGDGYFSGWSPGFPLLEGGSENNLFAGSPLTTGVLVPSGYTFQNGGGGNGDAVGVLVPSGYTFQNGGGGNGDAVRAHNEYRVATSQLFLESPYPDSEDEKIDEDNVTYDVSRRDMATQMSPVESPDSSPKGRPVLSTSPLLIASAMDHRSHHSAGVEVRDVQVDKRVTMSKQSKRHGRRMERNRSTEIKDLALTWNPTEEAMESSKLQKEEARIEAWENLQNAKAEASIRKLEMKLEKKKLASMEKIMSKLRIAQAKAQEMRQGISASEAPRNSRKIMSLRRYPKIALTCFRPDHF